MSESIDLICRADQCISCGACVAICPLDNIRLVYNGQREKYDARVVAPERCGQNCAASNCLRVCPSYEVDFAALGDAEANDALGRCLEVWTGRSARPGEALRASSAGVVRRLLDELLKADLIDGVIALSHDAGLDFTPKLLTDVADLPGSIYHNVNFAPVFDLIEQTDARLAVVALPCHIAGLTKYFSVPRKRKFQRRIVLTISLICGYSFSRAGIKAYARGKGIRRIDSVAYRGAGKGKQVRIGHSGGRHVQPRPGSLRWRRYVDFQLLFHPMLAQRRCLCCVDHLGYLADLVIGDAWLPRFANETEGTNLIVVRTQRGKVALEAASRGLELEAASPADLRTAQGPYARGELGEYFLRRTVGRGGFAPRFNRGSSTVRPHRPAPWDRLLLWAVEKAPRRWALSARKLVIGLVLYPLTVLQSAVRGSLKAAAKLGLGRGVNTPE